MRLPTHPSRPAPSRPARRQRGLYALEWALIFPVCFALLYAVIAYGLSFLVRESMQYAVEEGARAALRYPSAARIGTGLPTWDHRRDEAREATVAALGWLPESLRPAPAEVGFTVCRVGDAGCNHATTLNPDLVCDTASPCLVLVSLRIGNHADGALAPALPGLGVLLPDALEARASLLVDRRML